MSKVDVLDFEQKCGGGRCPKILMNRNGDVLVQGSNVDDEVRAHLNVPTGENVVFLPRDVMKEFLDNIE